jgi:DNA-binding Lrp family transcriptional regulator
MKDVELKVLSELMMDGRKSDRDLAKAIGVSQPTVSSFRKKLEAEGIIQEYTVIPDFRKLGYEILAVTFIKLRGDLNQEEIEKARKIVENMKLEEPYKSLTFQKLLDNFLSEQLEVKQPIFSSSSDIPQIKAKNCRKAILELLSSNWGNVPRTAGEIKEALEINALYFPASTIPSALNELTKNGKLRRIKKGERGCLKMPPVFLKVQVN